MQVGSHCLQKKAIQKQVKKILTKNIPKEELVYFRFSRQESQEKLRWKHDREFQYLGEMYDVVYKEIVNDSISYWCWWDTEETALYKKMKDIVAHSPDHLPGKKQSERKWHEFQKNLFCSHYINLPALAEHQAAGERLFTPDLYQSIQLYSTSPPPEYYFS